MVGRIKFFWVVTRAEGFQHFDVVKCASGLNGQNFLGGPRTLEGGRPEQRNENTGDVDLFWLLMMRGRAVRSQRPTLERSKRTLQRTTPSLFQGPRPKTQTF